MLGDLSVQVFIDGKACKAHSTFAWSGGGTVLTISTVLPERDWLSS